MTAVNDHACVLEINDIGILIKGKSGTGKTSLMLGLLERAKLEELNACMIADDQVFLKLDAGILIANAPENTAGLVELRGYGILKMPHKKSCEIKVVVNILEDKIIERMPDAKHHLFETLKLPLIEVPQCHETLAVRIVFAWLNENASLQVY